MSYALASVLQRAIFTHLSQYQPLTQHIGSALFDARPLGDVPDLYVAFGGESVVDRSDVTGVGASFELSFDVVTRRAGFIAAKDVAGIICDRLIDAPLSLPKGTLVSLRFVRAKAVKTGRNDTRKVTLVFKARVCGG